MRLQERELWKNNVQEWNLCNRSHWNTSNDEDISRRSGKPPGSHSTYRMIQPVPITTRTVGPLPGAQGLFYNPMSTEPSVSATGSISQHSSPYSIVFTGSVGSLSKTSKRSSTETVPCVYNTRHGTRSPPESSTSDSSINHVLYGQSWQRYKTKGKSIGLRYLKTNAGRK